MYDEMARPLRVPFSRAAQARDGTEPLVESTAGADLAALRRRQQRHVTPNASQPLDLDAVPYICMG